MYNTLSINCLSCYVNCSSDIQVLLPAARGKHTPDQDPLACGPWVMMMKAPARHSLA